METRPIASSESYLAELLRDSQITIRQAENTGADVFGRVQKFVELYTHLDLKPARAALLYQEVGSPSPSCREVGATLTVGRLPKSDRNPNGADLAVDDAQMSRRHFAILLRDDFHIVRDLGSRNGTYLNNDAEKVREQILKAGDVIRSGASLFVFTGTPFAATEEASLD